MFGHKIINSCAYTVAWPTFMHGMLQSGIETLAFDQVTLAAQHACAFKRLDSPH